MFINKKDLEMLIELEQIIYEIGIGKVNKKDLEKTIAPHYHKLYDLIEKLLKKQKITNKKNWDRISEKRKTNKNYGRKKLANGKYL